jgi:hypothetical protein
LDSGNAFTSIASAADIGTGTGATCGIMMMLSTRIVTELFA